MLYFFLIKIVMVLMMLDKLCFFFCLFFFLVFALLSLCLFTGFEKACQTYLKYYCVLTTKKLHK